MSLQRLPIDQRLQLVQDYWTQGYTLDEIAVKCKCSVRTVKRDLKKWRASGGFDDWVEHELLRLHSKGEVDDRVKYQNLTQLKKQTMTQRVEQKTEVSGGLDLKIVVEDDDDIQDFS